MKMFVKKWIKSFKKYFFSFKDGFYEIPFLANSPELIVESFGNMPFVKNYPDKRYFTTNNLFVNGDGHYQKIEEGLWIIISNINVKKNISFKLYYDKDFPADYHFLTLYVNRNKKNIKLPKLQFEIDFQDRAWTLYKANTECLNTHFTGQSSIYFTIYFSQKWLESNLSNNGILKSEKLSNFFLSDNEYLYLPNLLESKKNLYESLINSVIQQDLKLSTNLLELKSMTYELMTSFVTTIEEINFTSVSQNVTEKEKRLVFKAQHIIDESILEKFPSISEISKKIGVSETKLKSDFKLLTGTTMYQYFLSKQMIYANELLKNKEVKIKEVAFLLGYVSHSKFSGTFKKHFGYLPSEVE